MDKRVDLHVHTTFSDGVFTPTETVQYARKAGLAAISITDHDSVEGIPEALAAGAREGIEIIPGIELSAEVDGSAKSEMHILGYCIDWENAQFRETLTTLRRSREQRAQDILKKLQTLGIGLDAQKLLTIAGTGAIGRLHVAKALIEGGFVRDINDAFYKYLGIGKPAYVPKQHLTPADAIRMILRVGGVPVLAHPYYGHYSNRELLQSLVRDGLAGIEVWHTKHPPSTVDLFKRLARELQLVSTGGSDCHGSYADEPPMMGNVPVPYTVVEELKKRQEAIALENRDKSQ
jgi:predicted metal-dependent phosphoesterase TrpH